MTLVVVTGYRFSPTHQRFYAGGTKKYHDDGRDTRTLSMSAACAVCGDPMYDGDPMCGPRYEAEYWEIVHVNCCDQHAHPRVVYSATLGQVTELG